MDEFIKIDKISKKNLDKHRREHRLISGVKTKNRYTKQYLEPV